MNNSTEKKTQKWSRFVQQSPFKKYYEKRKINTTINNTEERMTYTSPTTEESSTLSWLSMAFCGVFSASKSASENKSNQQDVHQSEQSLSVAAAAAAAAADESFNAITTSSAGCSNQQEIEKKPSCSSITSNQSHEKDIVPLRQFLRYSLNRSDRRTFQRRRITQPSPPKYEIEWQKNQWLQLDNTTNKQIEQLRKNGFSKIAIRKDECLKKHIAYDNPSDIDVLLELNLNPNGIKEDKNYIGNDLPEPIVCHQPSQFSVRRTHWWQTSYQVGEANLPKWVDPDLCCNSVMMDARSVMAAVTSYSRRTSLASIQPTPSRYPDTPALSTRSSVNHLRTSSSTFSIKPLQYTEPPFVFEKPVLSAA